MCLTSWLLTYFHQTSVVSRLILSSTRAFTQGMQTSLPRLLQNARWHRAVTSRCRGAQHPGCAPEGDGTGAGVGAALTWFPRGFLPAEHIGTGVNVLQSSTGNFSKLCCALCPTRAAVCWPVKPASRVKEAVEQEMGPKAQAPHSPSPVSPTDLAALTSHGKMCLYSQCSFGERKDLLLSAQRKKKWDKESLGGWVSS